MILPALIRKFKLHSGSNLLLSSRTLLQTDQGGLGVANRPSVSAVLTASPVGGWCENCCSILPPTNRTASVNLRCGVSLSLTSLGKREQLIGQCVYVIQGKLGPQKMSFFPVLFLAKLRKTQSLTANCMQLSRFSS